MFEIKVVVDVPGLPDALNNLARALARGVNIPVTASVTAVDATAAAPTLPPVAPQGTPAQPEAPAAPVQETATQAPAANPAPAASTAPKVTMDEIARAGAALVDQGKMTELIGLLKNFGVPAVTQLREEQLPGFAVGLRALGAKI